MSSVLSAVRTHTVSIHKDVGLLTTLKDSGSLLRCVVKRIRPNSLIAEWNSEHPDEQVFEGDTILEVNGVSAVDPAFITVCRQCPTLKFKFRRAPRRDNRHGGMAKWLSSQLTTALKGKAPDLEVTITRNPQMGLLLRITERGLIVTNIKEGCLVHQWNVRHPNEQVVPGDCIIEVNGDRTGQGAASTFLADSTALAKQLKQGKDTHIDLRIKCTGELENRYRSMQYGSMRAEDFEIVKALDEIVPTKTRVERSFLVQLPRSKASSCDVDMCSICLSSLGADSELTELPCRHAFCTGCIQTWLTECRDFCPLCKDSVRRQQADMTPVLETTPADGVNDADDDIASDYASEGSHYASDMPVHRMHAKLELLYL